MYELLEWPDQPAKKKLQSQSEKAETEPDPQE
jgi:hypothetical protein